jgi:hypothetical protein
MGADIAERQQSATSGQTARIEKQAGIRTALTNSTAQRLGLIARNLSHNLAA